MAMFVFLLLVENIMSSVNREILVSGVRRMSFVDSRYRVCEPEPWGTPAMIFEGKKNCLLCLPRRCGL